MVEQDMGIIKETNRHLIINQSARYTHVCVLIFEQYTV